MRNGRNVIVTRSDSGPNHGKLLFRARTRDSLRQPVAATRLRHEGRRPLQCVDGGGAGAAIYYSPSGEA